jgi:hypothetical protein
MMLPRHGPAIDEVLVRSCKAGADTQVDRHREGGLPEYDRVLPEQYHLARCRTPYHCIPPNDRRNKAFSDANGLGCPQVGEILAPSLQKRLLQIRWLSEPQVEA